MVKKKDFLEGAEKNPQNVSFEKMISFLKSKGIKLRQKGSHIVGIYNKQLINIQPDKRDNKACKAVQVKQIINIFTGDKHGQ